MDLKSFLNHIGISVEDNDDAFDFLSEGIIVDFLCKKWESRSKQDIPETNNIQVQDIAEEIPVTEIKSVNIIDNDILFSDKQENESIINEELKIPLNVDAMGIFSSNNLPMEENAKERAKDDAFNLMVKNKPFILQNGKVGQEYRFQINSEIIEECQIGDYWFENIAELGLKFNAESHCIEGIPLQAGDYKVKWCYKHISWTEDKPALCREITIVINPDPRSLWNNIPTETDIPFYKTDSDKLFLPIAADKNFLGMTKERRKDMVAASQRGRSHAHEGSPRDDDFKLHYDPNTEWYTMVVADGAGSAKYSRKGSEIACNTVIEVCSSLLADSQKPLIELIYKYKKDPSPENRKDTGDGIYKILGSAVFKAYKNIETEAVNSKSQIKDFSTTLIISICRKFKFGWFVASFWVGDGGIGIYQKDTDYLKILGDSDGGEFAGQTRFLTMPEIMQPNEIYRRLRFEIVEDFTALILMTDGITDPKFETDANLLRKEKWDALWKDLCSEVRFEEDNLNVDSELLKWLDFWSQGNHDDRTIAILF